MNRDIGDIKSINDIFIFVGMPDDLLEMFWDYLNESEIAYGSNNTLTLIKANSLKNIMKSWFGIDELYSIENDMIWKKIDTFFSAYDKEYVLIC